MNNKSVSMVIALVLIVMITIVATSAAYYWLIEVQTDIQSGTSRYQSELASQIAGRLSIIDFQYNTNTKTAKIVIGNSGSRKIENIGSPEDSLIITIKTSSCNLGFNSTTCDVCPFDLDVEEIKEINIGFTDTDCENIEEGTEYSAYFALREDKIETSFIPTPIYNVWTKKNPASKPSARYGPAMAMIYNDDKVVLFGGYGSDSDCDGSGSNYCNGTWIYDLSEDDWTQVATPIELKARAYHSMATIYNDDKIILFGGQTTGSKKYNDTWVYDLGDDDWTEQSPASEPSNRTRHSAAMIYNDDKVVLFGGLGTGGNCDGSGSNYCNGTWVYDLSDDDWTKKSPASEPSGRYWHAKAAVYNDDKVVLFGGRDAGGDDDETWVYDLSDDDWTQKSPAIKPSAKYGHNMATIHDDNEVLLFGGWATGGSDDNTWIYDLSENNWIEKFPTSNPSPRFRSAMATISDPHQAVLFGGWDGVSYNNDTWVYV